MGVFLDFGWVFGPVSNILLKSQDRHIQGNLAGSLSPTPGVSKSVCEGLVGVEEPHSMQCLPQLLTQRVRFFSTLLWDMTLELWAVLVAALGEHFRGFLLQKCAGLGVR